MRALLVLPLGENHGRVDTKLATEQAWLTMALSKHTLVGQGRGTSIGNDTALQIDIKLALAGTTTPPDVGDDFKDDPGMQSLDHSYSLWKRSLHSAS